VRSGVDDNAMIDLLQCITDEVDKRFKNWAFRGSLVDWHYFNGNVIVKDFDIVTSDLFEPSRVCPLYGPRMSWRFIGRAVDVFYEAEVGQRMQSIEDRVARLQWLAQHYPHRAEKSRLMIERYKSRNHIAEPREMVTCQHRGEQIDVIRCDQCGQGRGQMKPVYACAIHGRCTHRLEQRGQRSAETPTEVCIGCNDGPWPPV
jgi:hypothetical protein